MNIAISGIPLKTRFFGLHTTPRMYQCIFNHFYVIVAKTNKFGEITQTIWPLHRLKPFKVTDYGTNRQPICDFLLVINSNVPSVLHRFEVTADYLPNASAALDRS